MVKNMLSALEAWLIEIWNCEKQGECEPSAELEMLRGSCPGYSSLVLRARPLLGPQQCELGLGMYRIPILWSGTDGESAGGGGGDEG